MTSGSRCTSAAGHERDSQAPSIAASAIQSGRRLPAIRGGSNRRSARGSRNQLRAKTTEKSATAAGGSAPVEASAPKPDPARP